MAVKTDRIKERESLKGDIRADVAVIGGGMAGILAAYTLEREGVHTVVLEAEAASKLGAPASLVRKLEIPVPCAGGVKFRGQAQFHPLKFLEALTEELTTYENSPVKEVEEERILTAGGSVKADKIIFATHYPFVNFPGMYFTRMPFHRTDSRPRRSRRS